MDVAQASAWGQKIGPALIRGPDNSVTPMTREKCIIGGRPMPRKNKDAYREYKFKIDAYTPDTIPMQRLAQYLTDLSTLLGNRDRVHFNRVEAGSTTPVIRVEWEAEPKVRERVHKIKTKEAPDDVLKAEREINRMLAEDNAIGVLQDPVGGKVLQFPGRELLKKLVFGPITQPGVFQGVPISVGGERDPVPIHLEDGKDKHIVWARRTVAKDIAQYLFTAPIRVEGAGRWIRHADGEWELLDFRVQNYKLVEDGDIRTNVAELRNIPSAWKQLDDPLAELDAIKGGRKPQ
jgi:hypothetical protein